MSRLLRLLSLLSFTICFTQSRLLENFKPTHVAGRSLPAQGTLLNDQLTDIYNQINVIQKPLNNVYQNPSGTDSSFRLNTTSDNYDTLLVAHETDTPYGSATVESALVTTANNLKTAYQLLVTGFIQKDGNGNPGNSKYTPADVASIRGGVTRQQKLVDQTYAILENVVTGDNVATVMKDIASIDNAIKSFFLNFK